MTDLARPTPPQEQVTQELVKRLQKAALAVYLAAEEGPAAHLSALLLEAANALLRAPALPAEPAVRLCSCTVITGGALALNAQCPIHAAARPAEEAPQEMPPCISACREKERLGIQHGLCATCAAERRASRAVEAERLQTLVNKWRDISARPNRPTGFRLCADELDALLTLRTE